MPTQRCWHFSIIESSIVIVFKHISSFKEKYWKVSESFIDIFAFFRIKISCFIDKWNSCTIPSKNSPCSGIRIKTFIFSLYKSFINSKIFPSAFAIICWTEKYSINSAECIFWKSECIDICCSFTRDNMKRIYIRMYRIGNIFKSDISNLLLCENICFSISGGKNKNCDKKYFFHM